LIILVGIILAQCDAAGAQDPPTSAGQLTLRCDGSNRGVSSSSIIYINEAQLTVRIEEGRDKETFSNAGRQKSGDCTFAQRVSINSDTITFSEVVVLGGPRCQFMKGFEPEYIWTIDRKTGAMTKIALAKSLSPFHFQYQCRKWSPSERF
jgi:hypothetical protein